MDGHRQAGTRLRAVTRDARLHDGTGGTHTTSVGRPTSPQSQSRFAISTPPNFPPLFFARLL